MEHQTIEISGIAVNLVDWGPKHRCRHRFHAQIDVPNSRDGCWVVNGSDYDSVMAEAVGIVADLVTERHKN